MKALQLLFFFSMFFIGQSCKQTFDKTDCTNLSDKIDLWMNVRVGDFSTFETNNGEQITLEVNHARYVSNAFKTTHKLCEGCYDSYEFDGDFNDGSQLTVEFDETESSYSLIVYFNYDSVDYGGSLIHADSLTVDERVFTDVHFYEAARPNLDVQYIVYDKSMGVSFIKFKGDNYWERIDFEQSPDRFIEHEKVEPCFESEAKSL